MNNSEINTDKIKILYVDDEPSNLIGFKSHFRREYDIYTCESAHEALDLIPKHDFQIVITDQRMPVMTGVEFLEALQKINPEPIRILLTGYTDYSALVQAVNKGQIYRYLQKPWDELEIIATINQALELFNLRRQNQILINELERVNDQLEFLLRQRLLS